MYCLTEIPLEYGREAASSSQQLFGIPSKLRHMQSHIDLFTTASSVFDNAHLFHLRNMSRPRQLDRQRNVWLIVGGPGNPHRNPRLIPLCQTSLWIWVSIRLC